MKISSDERMTAPYAEANRFNISNQTKKISVGKNNDLTLGVDIGTTSISAQVIDLNSGESIYVHSLDHNSSYTVENFDDAYAQDAERLLQLVCALVDSVTEAYPIRAIGLTGQMHGIVCLDKDGSSISPLYTWQNRFGARIDGASGRTLCDEIADTVGNYVPTGYGIVTLYSLARLGILPHNLSRIATVTDLAVARLCDDNNILAHPTNAASLGLYDISKRTFYNDKLTAIGINPSVMPRITSDYEIAGYYKGIPVAVAIGDNQAAAFGSLSDEKQILINVGTSSQISIISDHDIGGEARPYFDSKLLCSGSVLCGGRAYAELAELFAMTARLFGATPSGSDVYRCMNSLAEAPITDPLTVSTRFSGTREDETVRGKISNIGINNLMQN